MAFLAALLIFYLLGSRESAESPRPAAWLAFDTGSIRRIEIHLPETPARPLRFTNENGTWLRSGDTGPAPADTQMIRDFIQMVASLGSVDLVSDSPAKYPLFGLDDSSSARIILGDAPSIVLRAGLPSADGRSTYMRRADEPNVWAVQGFNRRTMDQLVSAEGWSD